MKRMLVAILAVVLLVSATACGQKAEVPTEESAPTWQEQYDLGIRYLSEGKYEEAILAFTAAIEIDPKQADAYVSLADVYLEQGQNDKAAEVLRDAMAHCDDLQKLEEKLAELSGSSNTQGTPEKPVLPLNSDGSGLLQGENLQVQIQDSRTATVTITGISVHDSYLTNLSTTEINVAEYVWDVELESNSDTYSVGTTWWAFDPGREEYVSIMDMQHSLWVHTEEGHFTSIETPISMSYTANSLSWTFTVPEEYPFSFDNVHRYQVTVCGAAVSYEAELNQTYEVQ